MKFQWIGVGLLATLAGCTSSWIADPSPSTRNLINDLRLEGYDCNARMSDIECIQKEPNVRHQASKCDSANGCIAQPNILVYNRYIIAQPSSGIPSLSHDIIEKVEGKLVGGTKVIPD
jgi:hypothetical protein